MILPEEKLDEVEFYETDLYQGHDKTGVPWAKDVIILHFGEYEKEYKLFGYTFWTEVIPDRTTELKFDRIKEKKEGDKRTFQFFASEDFKELQNQLEVYFKNDVYEACKELHDHELDFITE